MRENVECETKKPTLWIDCKGNLSTTLSNMEGFKRSHLRS